VTRFQPSGIDTAIQITLMGILFRYLFVALFGAWSALAVGTSAPWMSPTGLANRVVQEQVLRVDLAQEAGKELLQVLKRGDQQLNELSQWLRPFVGLNQWPAMSLSTCAQDRNCIFLRSSKAPRFAGDSFSLAYLHKNFRLALALSRHTNIWQWLKVGKSELAQLAVTGNPELRLPAYGPIVPNQEPLTPSERRIAQNILNKFWLDQVLAPKVQSLREKVLLRRATPNEIRLFQLLLEASGQRQPEDQVAQALRIIDAEWSTYWHEQLEKFYISNLTSVWLLVEIFRPLAYLPGARLSPAAVIKAVWQSADDNRNIQQEIEGNLVKLKQPGSTHTREIAALMEFPRIIDMVLLRRPDLRATAEILRRGDEQTRTAAALIPIVTLPLGPVFAYLGASAALTHLIAASLTSQAFESSALMDRDRQLDRYFRASSPPSDLPLTNATELEHNHNSLRRSQWTILTSLGLAGLRIGSLPSAVWNFGANAHP
jgi:hypothetical protein